MSVRVECSPQASNHHAKGVPTKKMMHHLRQHHHRRIENKILSDRTAKKRRYVTHPVTAANNIGMDEGNGSGTGMEMLQCKDLSSMDALV